MPNPITDTGIVAKSYNSRGLITHNGDTRALVRQANGTLWAAVVENVVNNPLNIYRSTDNGFSWDKEWSGGLTNASIKRLDLHSSNTNGPHISLQVFESIDRLILWVSYFETTSAKFNCEPLVFALSDPTTRITTGAVVTGITLDAESYAVDVPYNENLIWIVYPAFGELKVKQYRPTYQTTAEHTATLAGTFFDVFFAIAHQDGYVDIAILDEDTGNYVLKHVRYYAGTSQFEKHTVFAFGDNVDVTDVSIARDGEDNLLIVWSRETSSQSTDLEVWYTVGHSSGETWTAPVRIVRSAGHSAYRDAATGRLCGRTTALGGLNGFLLSYVRKNASEVPKTFVRTLTSTDGIYSTYELGDEREIATNIVQASDPVVGLRWFRPTATKMLSLSDPGQVRVAYQVGEGNETQQNDSVPVRFGQEMLSSSAYASTLESLSGSYINEGANSVQIPISFNILGAPNENVDFYALGLTGHSTTRYMAAFEKVGTETRFLRYEPNINSEMSDRSAYDLPTEFTYKIIIEPQTYQFPLADRGSDSFSSFVERDIRKIHIPPNAHLARNFVVNRGNFLKRTIWTVHFDGNEYEVSQIVPFFVQGQIGYYSANAYVVGASNDPFSRQTLPSET